MSDCHRKELSEILKTGGIIAVNRLETIGRLSSGLIHNLNNTLGILYGYLEMAMEEISPDSPVFSQLRTVDESTDKVRDAVNRFHIICNRAQERVLRFDLVAESRNLLQLIELFFPSSFFVTAHWPDYPLPVRGLQEQWRQALTNVLLGARDVLKDGGTVTIEAKEIEGWACLEVIDPGPPLESRSDVFSRIAAQCILDQFGGRVQYENGATGGVAVRFRLPLDVSS